MLDAKNAEAHLRIGLAQEKLGATAEAEQAFRQALALKADYNDSFDSLAVLYVNTRRDEDAIALLSRLIQPRSRFPQGRAHYMRCMAYAKQGDAPHARADADRACQLGEAQGCAKQREFQQAR